MPQLFISYRRSRKADVIAARDALEQAGVTVWLDLEGIDPLADFPARIREGIDGSHAMLAWWSADYAESDICLQELRRAWQHARRHSSDVARRVWVLNPEPAGDHIFAGELASSNFLAPPRAGQEAEWAGALRHRLDDLLPEGPLADERQAEPLPPLHGVPTPSNEFTGRGAELMRMHSALFPARLSAAARGVTVQTHGMGGIGKTELAAKYVSDFAHAYPAGIFWLNLAAWEPVHPAADADAQTAWLRALEHALALHPELWRTLALDAEGKPRSAPAVRERLAAHLGGDRPYLVVLDNLPELSPLDARRRVLDFLAAPGSNGRSLVTTRDARLVDGYAELDLHVMGTDDALRLLARYLPEEDRGARIAAERSNMAALIDEVGGHTQALVLLGERYGSDAGGYAAALASVREQGQLPRIETIASQLRGELGDKARGIVATFAVSIDPLPDDARHLLALASLCAPNSAIPDALLLLAFGGDERVDEFALALRSLLRASLLERRGASAGVRIHSLVAQAALALLQPDAATLREALAGALLTRLAVLQSDESKSRDLTADADQARHLAPRFASETGVRLYLRLGRYEEGRGQLAYARAAREAALALANQVLAEDHPDALASMNNLARSLGAQGELRGARALEERALAVRRRARGDEHPGTLTAMNNLAQTLQAQGDLSGARALHEQALAVCRRVLGEDHPDTLTSVNNLALTLQAQGDLGGARTLQEQVLAKRRLVLGEDHPDTAASINNLAMTLWAQGELSGARALQEQALAASRRALGDEHPNTLTLMSNLAVTFQAQEELSSARALEEQVLAVRRRALGEAHPDTLTSMNNLAHTLGAQGDLIGARALEEQVLAEYRRTMGETDPSTSIAAWNLFRTLDGLGEPDAAREVLATHLLWLVERTPTELGADQRTIRTKVMREIDHDQNAS